MLLKVAIERLHLHTGGTSVPLLYLKFQTNGERMCPLDYYVFNLSKEKMGAIILSH